MSDIVAGRPDGRAHVDSGGLELQKDGSVAGPFEPRLSFTQLPGVAWAVADDAPNERNNVTLSMDGSRLLSSVSGINLLSTGNTALYTVPTGLTLLVDAVILRCTEATAITSPASAGAGEGAGANNVFPAQILTGLNQAALFFMFPPGGTIAVLTAGQVLNLGVTAPAVGTSQLVSADLIGRTF